MCIFSLFKSRIDLAVLHLIKTLRSINTKVELVYRRNVICVKKVSLSLIIFIDNL